MKKKQYFFWLLATIILLTHSSIKANDELNDKEIQHFKISGTTVQASSTDNLDSYSRTDFNNSEKESEKILPNTRILILYENILVGKINSDKKGKFQLNGLRKGDYILFAKNDENDLSGIACFSLTSDQPQNEEIRLRLTNDSTLDDFFREKWNDQRITRGQMPHYQYHDEPGEALETPQQMMMSHRNHIHVFHHNDLEQYGGMHYGMSTGCHWGSWLAAGALSAAIVALAVEDDVSPEK
ncbi:MAG: hypothetical protein Q4C95_00465 [Planctomycetia bacterium]|nr:hypothetical protein [Planctomycetia bacterium]